MKRPHLLRTSLVVCVMLVNLGLMGPAVAGNRPAVDPVSGLPTDVRTPASSNHSTAKMAASLWIKYAGNPVLDLGSSGAWDSIGVDTQSVLMKDGSYMMWYTGVGASSHKSLIGLATSPDGVNWTRSPDNPVLTVGAHGAWDSANIIAPQVIYHDGIYEMWYRGMSDTLPSPAAIGYATSTDGMAWIKYAANPVLTVDPSAWDSGDLWSAYVIAEGSTYKMWYSSCNGSNCRIGVATSPDGIVWTKYTGNPILDIGPKGSWDSQFVYYPTVINNGLVYEMWYSGMSTNQVFAIGHATSPDGLTWTRDPDNPLFSTGPIGSWDSDVVLAPAVVAQSELDMMWYTGFDAANNTRIGVATLSFFTERVYLPMILR